MESQLINFLMNGLSIGPGQVNKGQMWQSYDVLNKFVCAVKGFQLPMTYGFMENRVGWTVS